MAEALMYQTFYLLAFGVFFVIMIILALFLRKISVDDIFKDTPQSRQPDLFKNVKTNALPAPRSPKVTADSLQQMLQKQPKITTSPNIQTVNDKRATTNKIGKGLSALGVIMLILPLPDSFMLPSMGMIYVGYLITRASAPPKKKK